MGVEKMWYLLKIRRYEDTGPVRSRFHTARFLPNPALMELGLERSHGEGTPNELYLPGGTAYKLKRGSGRYGYDCATLCPSSLSPLTILCCVAGRSPHLCFPPRDRLVNCGADGPRHAADLRLWSISSSTSVESSSCCRSSTRAAQNVLELLKRLRWLHSGRRTPSRRAASSRACCSGDRQGLAEVRTRPLPSSRRSGACLPVMCVVSSARGDDAW